MEGGDWTVVGGDNDDGDVLIWHFRSVMSVIRVNEIKIDDLTGSGGRQNTTGTRVAEKRRSQDGWATRFDMGRQQM